MSNQAYSTSVIADHPDIGVLLDDVQGLVSPPEVCMKLFELINSPAAGSKDIARIVNTDPNLVVRLLRVANSSFYGFSGKIDTISRAITLIGTSELYQLVLSITALKSFSNIPNDLVSMNTFWRHSVYTGLLAKALAKRANFLHPERLFITGLMHDIGGLVFYHQCPEAMRDLLLVADGDEEVLYQAECEQFGFGHAELAGQLTARWNFPRALSEAVACHHRPQVATDARLEAYLIYLANQLVNESDQGNFMGSPRADLKLPQSLLDTVGLSEDELFFAFEEAAEQFPGTLKMFF